MLHDPSFNNMIFNDVTDEQNSKKTIDIFVENLNIFLCKMMLL